MTKDYSKQGTTLRQIMDHAYWGPQFREYAASRHADESILFLNELSAYKCEGQSRVQQEQFAAMLMDTYFTDSAPKWVNLASRTREALLNDFASSKYATVHDLFKEAMHEAFSDIKHSETFKTFCLGEEAQQFCNDADTLLLDDLVVMENFIKLVGFLHGDKEMIDLLRFCCSVAEFERLCETAGATPGSDKKLERMALRNKISATFVQPGSRLQLENLPQLYVDAILAGGHDHVFSDARIEALQIFCLHQEFMASCRGMSGMVQ